MLAGGASDAEALNDTNDPTTNSEDFTWARCGAMILTGHRQGHPLAPRSPIGTRVRGALCALVRVAPNVVAPSVSELLCARAASNRWRRAGRRSANGTCGLLRTRDHWVAVNLARESDRMSLPAMVERDPGADPWACLKSFAEQNDAATIRDRGNLVGIPTCVLGESIHDHAVRHRELGERRRGRRELLVVDLSSMWAGPLCARILGQAGAAVVKVESLNRLDGTRFGNPNFYNWLHHGHKSVVFDFTSASGRQELRSLLNKADIVIEGSRPRALAAFGIDPVAFVGAGSGRIWLSLTGYGRSSAGSNRAAFGDDAAVAGGLVAYDEVGEPVFSCDAIADPLAGLSAAIAVFSSLAAGRGAIIEMSMSGVAAYFAAAGPDAPKNYTVSRSGTRWTLQGYGKSEVCSSSPMPLSPPAATAGANTREYASAGSPKGATSYGRRP